MQKTKWRLAGYILPAFLFSACGDGDDAELPEVVRPVKFIEVKRELNYRKVELPAVVRARFSSDVSFKVSGQLVEFPISESMKVKKGQKIGALDQRNFKNEVAAAETNFQNSKLDYERAVTLLGQDAIAKKVHDARKAVYETAKAKLDTVKKALDDTVVYSPFDGVVSAKHVEKFDNVQALAKIVTVQSVGEAEVTVQQSASMVANIKNVEHVDAILVLDAAPQFEMPVEFVSATTEADPQTQTFEVTFSFTPPETMTILPGMTGTVRAKVTSKDPDLANKMRIPVSAISAVGDDRFVWLIDPKTTTASRRDVKVGESLGQRIVIESGLKDGDIIAGTGGQYLHEGMKVSEFKN